MRRGRLAQAQRSTPFGWLSARLGENLVARKRLRRYDGLMKMLLVEDDFDLSRALSKSLATRGFDVLCCADGIEALTTARKKAFDVIVLDLGLPGLDGLDLLERLRDGGNATPVLVLTARGAINERVAGLNLGADDYLAKPFDLDELAARLHALTRRVGRDGQLYCGLLHYDALSGAFYRDQRPLGLSPREGELLHALMSRVDRVVPKEALHAAVFGDDAAFHADAVEVIVHRLRKKISGSNAEILTLRGVGYLLCVDVGPAAAGKSP